MPTATAANPLSPARSFALAAIAWSLGLFGLLRLTWIEAVAVLPLTRLQGRIAALFTASPVLPVDVTLACSATDVIALCAGAILAYPARWRVRVAGAAAGICLILGVNIIRIASLAHAADAPRLFEILHVYVWPAALVLVVAAYVFGWMRWVSGGPAAVAPAALRQPAEMPAFTRRFALLTVAFVVVFAAASPLYLQSAWVLSVAAVIARGAAFALRSLGIDATATANVLMTSRGGFIVTQECVSTPLIPVYLAAAAGFTRSWRTRVPAMAAVVLLVVALGIARLLVIALPASLVGSPSFLIHAFYQLLLGVVLIALAALWRHGRGVAGWRRAVLAAILGGVFVYLFSQVFVRLLSPVSDAQGAVAFLPGFQIGLLIALWIAAWASPRPKPLLIGLALLAATQLAAYAALRFAMPPGVIELHVPAVRGWAVAAPVLIAAAMRLRDRPRP
ncbi:MAG: archaeosortase/exosortase family protein [Acidobacteriota bacterium]|nr:archaeosortase/exosortase family protein [Acidobacteriota bacterium]